MAGRNGSAAGSGNSPAVEEGARIGRLRDYAGHLNWDTRFLQILSIPREMGEEMSVK
ncbi:MAG: hypothetical protein BroJett011_73550 [Chloroflexota bacterium]|nr:MAG: hypothetical protein BroJett011_73550 [Chloroflexota bacterium]